MRKHETRGQAIVEFALTIPIFIVLLVAVFDLGHVVWANNALATAAREAARFAIVHGGSSTTECPVGPPVPGVTMVPGASEDCPFPSPSKQAVKNEALDWLIAVGGTPTVSVCYGVVSTCTGDTDAVGATNERGTPLTVTVRATVDLAAPSLFGFDGFDLSANSTMLVNH